ncbi:hypothetical protein CBOM_03029 [Ceraceosorus bombacis]|uniref:Uncharacterized protein n=1 Tax=Ceraceosorus bombacis TaxID=401625 RepID=A0A0P1BM99_9BASI|nr:hypothetical protein CBOM_03029 [Ceraceosorus bombacis]
MRLADLCCALLVGSVGFFLAPTHALPTGNNTYGLAEPSRNPDNGPDIEPADIKSGAHYRVLAEKFIASLMYPNNIHAHDLKSSPLFEPTMIGRVEQTTTFAGDELNVEYLYYLFQDIAANAQSNGPPRAMGYPYEYNITQVAVENNVVVANAVTQWNWGRGFNDTQDFVLPIELTAWIWYSKNDKIQQYDLSFKRADWVFDIAADWLLPQIAHREGWSVNTTTVRDVEIRRYTADYVCKAALANCHGKDEHYESYDDCMSVLNGNDPNDQVPLGTPSLAGENTLWCRFVHTPMLPIRPAEHCPHVARSGGTMCIDRDYRNVTNENIYPKTMKAPLVALPSSKSLESTSPETIRELDFVSSDKIRPETPYWFSVNGLVLFAIFWILALVIDMVLRILPMTRKRFTSLSWANQRTTVVYVLNIFFTTAALALQLAASPSFSGNFKSFHFEVGRAAVLIISELYLFELIYRAKMRPPMIAHHILTVFAISFTIILVDRRHDPAYLCCGLAWLFQATTEQTTFIGLFMYRMCPSRPRMVRHWLHFAAIQGLIAKLAATGLTLWVWAKWQRFDSTAIGRAYTVILWIAMVALLATQVWGAMVTFSIGSTVEKRFKRQAEGRDSRRKTVAPPALLTSGAGSTDSLEKGRIELRDTSTAASLLQSRRGSDQDASVSGEADVTPIAHLESAAAATGRSSTDARSDSPADVDPQVAAKPT